MRSPAHEVYVLCDCGDILNCRMERYVSDVRIAYRELERLREPDDEPADAAAD